MRPKYETTTDLRNEFNVASEYAASFGCSVVKMPMQYRIDFAIVDASQNVLAFIEVKRRLNNMNAYSTCILSLSKVMAAIEMRKTTKKNCYFLVAWNDATGIVELTDKYDVKIGGRKDRNDWQDIEPVVHIPVSDFEVIEKCTTQ